jgi:hypothetical protein
MTRRALAVLLVVLALSGAALAAGSGATPLVVPPAQSIALEAIKGVSAIPRFRLPAGATAMVAAKGDALFAIVVNRTGRASSVSLGATGKSRSITDITKAAPGARAGFSKAVGKLLGWNPLATPSDLEGAGVTLRLYDSAHPNGKPLAARPARQAATDAGQLLQGLAISVRDDLYKQIDEVSGCILGRVQCGRYVFTFSGLKETVERADDPTYHLTTIYSGRTCGRTPEGQPWKITYRSGNKGPVTKTLNLQRKNVVYVTSGKIKGIYGTAIHKLAPLVGAFPQMEVLVDSTGGWRSNAGGLVVPVLVSKLPPGKHC